MDSSITEGDHFEQPLAGRGAEAPGEDEFDDSSLEDGLSYRWTDAGVTRPDGTEEHQTLEVVVNGSKSIVRVGDSIFLKSDEEDSDDGKFYEDGKEGYFNSKKEDPSDAFVARVEEMWEDPPDEDNSSKEMRMKIRARWFFKKQDVEGLHGSFAGAITREELLAAMTDRDVLLGNQADENDVLTILGKCTVINRRPTQDAEPIPPLPDGSFVCRYLIDFGRASAPGAVFLSSYEGENDSWPSVHASGNKGVKRSFQQDNVPKKRARKQYDSESADVEDYESLPTSSEHPRSIDQSGLRNESEDSDSESDVINPMMRGRDTNGISSDDDLSDDMSTSSFRSDDEKPQETEGSTTVGRIQVGTDYQAEVPPFTSYEPFPRTSRNPALLWKRNAVSDDALDDYLSKAAVILNDFLEQNELLAEDPYTPLPTEKVEAKVLAEGQDRPLTMSDVSTGSSVATARNKLTRECEVDALMSVLLRHNHDTKAALEAVAASPQDVLTVWTPAEKEMFDSGFRNFNGSLRQISKQGLAASKSFKEIVDYHYRFKIPGQFRRYQEKKRELAVRMMECIESRRYYESLIPKRCEDSTVASGGTTTPPGSTESAEEKKQARDWAKTGGAELVGAAEDRRIGAKELLYEVKNEMGRETMFQVASAVKSYEFRSVPELKESLVSLLQERPDLLERFLEFLPLRFR